MASSAEGFRIPAAKSSLSGRFRLRTVIAKGLSGFAVCKDQPQLSVRRLEAKRCPERSSRAGNKVERSELLSGEQYAELFRRKLMSERLFPHAHSASVAPVLAEQALAAFEHMPAADGAAEIIGTGWHIHKSFFTPFF